MKYYRVLDNLEIEDRWFLGELEGIEFDFWKYVTAKPLKHKKENSNIIIAYTGAPLDFSYAAFELIIVNEQTKNIFSSDDVNFYEVFNKEFTQPYYLMHILNAVDCVDEKKSSFSKFKKDDPIRSDLAGKYKEISNLKLKKQHTFGHEIFRVKNYDSVVIVSETIKNKFANLNLNGVTFMEV